MTSKYFDSIRIAPRKQRGIEKSSPGDPTMRAHERRCDWDGCRLTGKHRAPKNRAAAGAAPTNKDAFQWFCDAHIKEFNAHYDFFQGMSDEDVAAFQRDARTGHRPTWGLGKNAANFRAEDAAPSRANKGAAFRDAFGLFGDEAGGPEGASRPSRRKPRVLEQQALDTLGLDASASLNDIKARYKELVKKHHPDANGGERSSEERLRKVIQAYSYLKKSGFAS